jgi:hypothetical protein
MISDTQQKMGPGWHSHTASILAQKNYSFITMVGDFVEDGIKAEWNDFFTRAQPYLAKIPIIPIQGNHDRSRESANGTDIYYFDEFFPQTQDKIIGLNSYDTAKQFYYSFNWSNVHIQVLHFPQIDLDDAKEPGGINPKDYFQAFTADQLQWIRTDLANAQNLPFRLTFFHCPVTGAGFYGPNSILLNELVPILTEYNVTATIHGHAHHYERGTISNVNGTYANLTYFLMGCGGGLVDVALRPVPETDICIASPCYTEVNVAVNQMTFKTYSFEGNVLDEFSVKGKEGI